MTCAANKKCFKSQVRSKKKRKGAEQTRTSEKKTEVRSDVLEELASFANRSQTMVFFVEWSKTEKSFDN